MKRFLKIRYSDDMKNKLKKFKKEINNFKSELKKRNIIIKIKKIITRSELFEIKLYGYDKKLKYITNKINIQKILNKIDNMPIGKLEKKNIELYTNAHPENTIHNLGFKNLEKAKQSIKLTNKLKLKDQFRIINLLYYRAKYHPYKTDDIKQAMKFLKKWLDKHKKN